MNLDTDMLQILLAGAAAGAVLGWLQFRGLWATVSRLPTTRHPGSWVMLSLLARMALTLAGLWLLATQGGIPALAAALAGMLLVRTWLQRRIAPAPAPAHGAPQTGARSTEPESR